jgi:hypothetical protein
LIIGNCVSRTDLEGTLVKEASEPGRGRRKNSTGLRKLTKLNWETRESRETTLLAKEHGTSKKRGNKTHGYTTDSVL